MPSNDTSQYRQELYMLNTPQRIPSKGSILNIYNFIIQKKKLKYHQGNFHIYIMMNRIQGRAPLRDCCYEWHGRSV